MQFTTRNDARQYVSDRFATQMAEAHTPEADRIADELTSFAWQNRSLDNLGDACQAELERLVVESDD